MVGGVKGRPPLEVREAWRLRDEAEGGSEKEVRCARVGSTTIGMMLCLIAQCRMFLA